MQSDEKQSEENREDGRDGEAPVYLYYSPEYESSDAQTPRQVWEETTGEEGSYFAQTYHYDADDGVVVGQDEVPSAKPHGRACPDCNGTGSILLLISTRPCTRCCGSGTL